MGGRLPLHAATTSTGDGRMVVRSRYFEGEPCWADAVAPDMDAARRFYGEVFGWTFVAGRRQARDYVLCMRNDHPVAALTPPMSDDGGPPVWTTFLKTADATIAAERIDEAGGRVPMAAMEVADGSRVVLA